MTIAEILPFLALGAVAGTLAGLLGIGGGILIVPGLAFLLGDGTVPADRLMQFAVGTSLATIVATALSSIRAHHGRGAVDWPVMARLTPGIIGGALLGAAIADVLPTRTLAIVFGVFLLIISVRLFLPGQPAAHRRLPGLLGTSAYGAGIGTLSSLLGIGGGTLSVPLLTWHNMDVRAAVGTASACGLPIAVAGTIGFIFMGLGTSGLPAGATGYVYWPAFLAVVPTSMAFAQLGARLAHTLPRMALRRGFALFVAIVGIRMLMG
jgi:uncharacterized membrane protein YfcA